MKRLAWLTTVVMATGMALVILWEFRLILIFFLFSLVAAAAVRPMIDGLVKRRLSVGLSILVTYLSFVLALLLLFYVVGGALLRELQQATDDFASWYEFVKPAWSEGTSLQQAIAARLPTPSELYQGMTGEEGQVLVATALGVTSSILAIVGGFIVVIVLSIYWSIDRVYFERLLLSLLPAGRRKQARDLWRTIEPDIGAYVRSELTQSVLAGIFLGLGYAFMGLPYPTILAFVGAVAWLIPLVGIALAVLPVVMVGLNVGPVLAAGAAVYAIVVLVVLELKVEPRFFARRRYGSLLTILIVAAMADAYGLPGLLVGPPLSAVIQIIYRRWVASRTTTQPAQEPAELKDLHQRLAAVEKTVAEMDEPPPEVMSVMNRLGRLMEQAAPVLHTGGRTKVWVNQEGVSKGHEA